MGIVSDVGEVEPEFPAVPGQPSELAGSTEASIEVEVGGRADIEGPTGMVLAASGCGDQPEDLPNRLPGGEF